MVKHPDIFETRNILYITATIECLYLFGTFTLFRCGAIVIGTDSRQNKLVAIRRPASAFFTGYRLVIRRQTYLKCWWSHRILVSLKFRKRMHIIYNTEVVLWCEWCVWADHSDVALVRNPQHQNQNFMHLLMWRDYVTYRYTYVTYRYTYVLMHQNASGLWSPLYATMLWQLQESNKSNHILLICTKCYTYVLNKRIAEVILHFLWAMHSFRKMRMQKCRKSEMGYSDAQMN